MLITKALYNNVLRYDYYRNTLNAVHKTIICLYKHCACKVQDGVPMYSKFDVHKKKRESLLEKIDY
jgi:hypothetical protein